MHQLQTHVISRLILAKDCRYRDLKPKEVDGNVFTYHLKQLISDDLVEKRGLIYQLTPAGLRLADQLSLASFKPRIQPKIVTLLAVRNNRGDYLLYRRRRQPFRGLVGFPYGKLHLGESILSAAGRELREKTGISAELKHRGDAYLNISKEAKPISFMLCHVFAGHDPVGQITEDSPIGSCFWAQITNPGSDYFFPGFKEILSLIKSTRHGRFFAEINKEM